MATSCYHCHQPVPEGTRYGLTLDGCWQPMCCAGCEAVAGAILGQGLEDFYRLRESAAGEPADPAIEEDLGLYDHPDLQRGFVREGPGCREVTLLLEGIRCPACVWLNEQTLSRVPGVLAAQANFATRRATVRWDPYVARLSDILAAVRTVGYRASPYEPGRAGVLQTRERRDALWRLFVAGFGMMQVMMYALPAYIAGEGDMSADIGQLMRWASFALTLPVVLYAAAPFFRGAWRDLAARRAGMDVPVALGIGVAFGASVVSTFTGAGEVYYDSVAMFVFLLLLGRFLEVLARQRAGRSLDHLSRLAPAFAQRLRDYPRSLEFERIPAVTLRPGDLVLVRPGEAFPADGSVLQGAGAVSEALLTGESRPVSKQPGSEVIGGSVNLAEAMVTRVERTGEHTVLSGILRLIEQAAAQKPPITRFADRWVPVFIASVIALALAAGLAWAFIDARQCIPVMVAVLVATCPCALSLATPVALTVATAELARRGFVITRAHALEAFAKATDFVFDKTGTLTAGEPRLVEVTPLGASTTANSCATSGANPAAASRQDCVALAAAIESASEHPIGRAFGAASRESPGAHRAVGRLRNFPGEGIEAEVDGRLYRIGSASFTSAISTETAPADSPSRNRVTRDAVIRNAVIQDSVPRNTFVWLASEAGLLARFEIADALRREAAQCVRSLREIGIAVHLLSGDDAGAVGDAAAALGIAHAEARAAPPRKRQYVGELQERGRRVAMVGDGINDAPVLAQADVSAALGSGARLAQINADAVMLSDDLGELPHAVLTARKCLSIVRQNVAWAFVYNLTVLPLAVSGLLTPWAAAIGMSASSLLVVVNTLRLQERGGSASEARFATRAPLHESIDPA